MYPSHLNGNDVTGLSRSMPEATAALQCIVDGLQGKQGIAARSSSTNMAQGKYLRGTMVVNQFVFFIT